MERDRNWSTTIRGTGQFDDEITLPLRIVCERKSDRVPSKTEESSRKDASKHREAQKLVRAS